MPVGKFFLPVPRYPPPSLGGMGGGGVGGPTGCPPPVVVYCFSFGCNFGGRVRVLMPCSLVVRGRLPTGRLVLLLDRICGSVWRSVECVLTGVYMPRRIGLSFFLFVPEFLVGVPSPVGVRRSTIGRVRVRRISGRVVGIYPSCSWS